MTILDAVLAFAVTAGLLTLVPGLDTALVLRSTLTQTRPHAWATALGVATGAVIWGIASAVGVSALLTASAVAYRVLTTAGAVYMLWLGLSMVLRSFRGHPADTPDARRATEPAASPWRGWLTGAGTNLLNPKVGVFYVATIPQFLPHGVSPLLMGILLAGVHAVLTMVWFSALILGGGRARTWLANPRALAMIDRVTGLVLVGFAAKLLVDLVSSSPLSAGPARLQPA